MAFKKDTMAYSVTETLADQGPTELGIVALIALTLLGHHHGGSLMHGILGLNRAIDVVGTDKMGKLEQDVLETLEAVRTQG